MREIKFRVWAGRENRYATKCSVGWNGFDLTFGEDGTNTRLQQDGDVLEQFIGLKSKDGRDIYEGDIIGLKGPHDTMPAYFEVTWCVEDLRYEASRPGIRGRPYDLSSLNPRFVTVCGNIHETPELLEPHS